MCVILILNGWKLNVKGAFSGGEKGSAQTSNHHIQYDIEVEVLVEALKGLLEAESG